MKVYGDRNSGNCQKISFTADFLQIPYQWIDIDITKGESRTDAYLRKSPMGQVPMIELDDGRCLAQSNAIIRYLAQGTSLLPDDTFTQAKIDELLFWEQYSHEPYVATSRYHMVYLGRSKDEREAWRVERGEKALDLMQRLIKGRMWFVGDSLSVADIALLAYTRLAHEGGFDLNARPDVKAWIMRAEMALGLPPAGN
ncbi:glutathione S-transferase family protein [Aestuariivirga sp. YIM B02566]|uniref:Glutathione S-transferase family protein n=1 Tax=Taklimakanibacter albus TaxID=2800327 RepID=A0ACC5R5M7_9HYPH|nr:glutathione S-transferase family protein [Aestuariivirga sp. YIM B02566]MBK1867964.1 glutathione S-transferase family protein [Aestuariivirga sp. YIM B02566]